MTTDEPSPYATRIVRIFPDHADSVVWFSDPVPYDETGLTAELVERLAAWETSYYAALTDTFEWSGRISLHDFDRTGLALAHDVAEEIGPDVEVEYRSFEDSGAIALARAEGEATNPDARDAFARRAQRERERWAALRARRSEGAGTVWFARSASGAEFRPVPPEDPSAS
ncbi:hypothetical protein DVJ78_05910 [Humibacter sp. BT305]|nr:hypothetical protein DVJ78_05910 [Humibacter sp. BT305]